MGRGAMCWTCDWTEISVNLRIGSGPLHHRTAQHRGRIEPTAACTSSPALSCNSAHLNRSGYQDSIPKKCKPAKVLQAGLQTSPTTSAVSLPLQFATAVRPKSSRPISRENTSQGFKIVDDCHNSDKRLRRASREGSSRGDAPTATITFAVSTGFTVLPRQHLMQRSPRAFLCNFIGQQKAF